LGIISGPTSTSTHHTTNTQRKQVNRGRLYHRNFCVKLREVTLWRLRSTLQKIPMFWLLVVGQVDTLQRFGLHSWVPE
jgi:hypothetical protein